MLSLPTKKISHKETFGGERYVQYLGYGDDIMGVCVFSNSLRLYIKCVQFCVYQLYLNKAKKKTRQMHILLLFY